ncbi:hypothetical protein [Parabacteroides sp. FAFU027]|uniref:hypothetical protein n=1 Tax=Parabacteroides sp. FAFU027 TaxID=2922715 RepID=UPI001FAF4C75|nr:hypothetical protein [Parabacteroides sp. FAFU027]
MKKLWVSMMACAFLLATSGAIAQTTTKPAEKEKKEAPAPPAHKKHMEKKAPMKKECEKKDADKKECMKKEGEKKAINKKAHEKAPEKK